jgi:cytochrome b subunit of formate dehydrogenase
MGIALQILLGLVSLICLLGGMNLLLKGSGSFLPETVAVPPVLDNLFRFLSGIYFGLGFLMAYVIFNLPQINDLIYFIGIVVIFSGLGRLYSRMKVGSSTKYLFYIMWFEILLGIVIIVLQYFRK